ncbi:peptidoglycan DD-metalloendopeptidase family protein [Chamaesiphon sp. VAR_48_metabat_403]|uniref:M23 family metallopeptidase n=1 Tax=Chamaesiphon sp. VAR_48_metabat_403 TaxID=2964700 RepID=UPI00286E40B0|nr:peptidoglycan DD-metalloendopeptidase family protein [Chamaesiphon sp. VAR_48_metabat_403]
MSSKAEKTSHHSYQQSRSHIFFRNPLLLKIVAWLGSLSFIGSTGVVWADLKPISTNRSPVQATTPAPALASADNIAKSKQQEIYGPYLPISTAPAPTQIAPNRLPNREVPIAVTPGSAAISPSGTIVRPQHTDLLTADNYTVGVNGSGSTRTATEPFIDIPVPAPLRNTIPARISETISMTSSQVRPTYIKPQPLVVGVASLKENRSTPTTGIQTPTISPQSATSYRTVVPTVTKLPTTVAISPRNGLSAANSQPAAPTATRTSTIAATATSPAQSPYSVQIAIPTPRTQRIEVQPVAQLPKVNSNRQVPRVTAIPSVRPAAAGLPPTAVAFVNPGENENGMQLIYPLSSPAPQTSSYGWRTHPITGSRRFHSGVDIGAPMGAPIVAAGSGTIVTAGWYGGYGKAIVIQHNGVQQTLYGHLSEIFVQPGQRIEQGTVIGRVGSTGNSTGPHLHFESRVATADGWIAIDPGEEMKYALDNLRRSMPFAQRDLPNIELPQ